MTTCWALLGLFGDEVGRLDQDDLSLAQALVHVASVAIVNEKAASDLDIVNSQLQHALTSRIVLEQAKGVIATPGAWTMDDAFRSSPLRPRPRPPAQRRRRTRGQPNAASPGAARPRPVCRDLALRWLSDGFPSTAHGSRLVGLPRTRLRDLPGLLAPGGLRCRCEAARTRPLPFTPSRLRGMCPASWRRESQEPTWPQSRRALSVTQPVAGAAGLPPRGGVVPPGHTSCARTTRGTARHEPRSTG